MTTPDDAREPNDDEVICPNCVHQFRAIPVNVQAELARLTEACNLIDAPTPAAAPRTYADKTGTYADTMGTYAESLLPPQPLVGFAPDYDQGCAHNWVDGQNEKVSGDIFICTACHQVHMGPRSTAPPVGKPQPAGTLSDDARELCARLNADATAWASMEWTMSGPMVAKLEREAAALIERQTQEIARLRELLHEIRENGWVQDAYGGKMPTTVSDRIDAALAQKGKE
jgi:hypothetical protein